MYIKVSKIIPGGGGGLLVLSYLFMAMDGVVMGCLCGYEQISLQKECTQFLHKVTRFLHKVS